MPIAIAVGILLLGSMIYGAFTSGGSDRSVEAKSACHQTVRSNLKAPSTAKFSSTVAGHNTRANDYLVTGTVDAQNSFGAMVRSEFQCVVVTSGSTPRVTLQYLR